MICTFFGHRDCPSEVEPLVEKEIIRLIECCSVNRFLVGNDGAFDKMVQRSLWRLKEKGYIFHFDIVLAYLPKEEIKNAIMFPSFEITPPRFAIDRRNHYMLDCADVVVVYVVGVTGGAHKFYQKAINQGKRIVNLAI